VQICLWIIFVPNFIALPPAFHRLQNGREMFAHVTVHYVASKPYVAVRPGDGYNLCSCLESNSVKTPAMSRNRGIPYHLPIPLKRCSNVKIEKNKVITVTGHGRLQGCEMLRIPHCLDSRLTVNCEILATCSSTYSPVRTSQEAHSVSIK
jgi:hypothetical protein